MPWKASSVMEERLRFVARLLDGEAMTEVCRDFGISRKTGYKIFDRAIVDGSPSRGARGGFSAMTRLILEPFSRRCLKFESEA
jgi:transposase-like protein